jgi:hypothetical protein
LRIGEPEMVHEDIDQPRKVEITGAKIGAELVE